MADTPPEPRFTRYECSAKCPYLAHEWAPGRNWCILFARELGAGDSFKNPERCDECVESQEVAR